MTGWFEVEIPEWDMDETPDSASIGLSENYLSLAGLCADLVDNDERAKVIVSVGGARVLLSAHPRMYCPLCQGLMKKMEVGPYLFKCTTGGCNHAEGDTER